MGNGVYSYTTACLKAATSRSLTSTMSVSEAREATFKHRSLDSEMNIKDKIRESRDSEEHPNSFPIIIALDTTGSMGHIPMDLIQNSFPEIMKSLLDSGVKDAQVCFIGVGDCYCDDAPIQCGQFESSDELMEKWFQKVYLEMGGGGNPGESYNLAWYFASRHTVTDSWEKRNKKGVLITLGDEPCLSEIPKNEITKLFGDPAQTGITSTDLIKEVQEKWNVYHIHFGHTGDSTSKKWNKLLGKDNVIVLPRDNYNLIPTISDIILSNINSSTESVSNSVKSENNTVKISL